MEGFLGFGGGMMPFFAELAENQSRDWFNANKPRFEREIQAPMEALVTSVSLALAVRDIPLLGTPKASMFRINRDIRFSKDKTPYKTHTSAVLTRTGTKRSQGLLYFQAGLGQSFAALGFYQLEPKELTAIRDAILAKPEAWRKVIAQLGESSLMLSREQMTARIPRGYEDADLGDWFRLKSFFTRRDLSPTELSHSDLVTAIADFATAGLPLLRFGWKALSAVAPQGFYEG